jgi:hypothetical protein
MDFKIGFMPTREKVSGLEIALATNTKEGKGARFAFLHEGEKFTGFELGFMSFVKDYKGLQINKLYGESKNYTGIRTGLIGNTESFRGLDFNLVGKTENFKGLKFSSLYNYAHELTGIQQSDVINIADKYKGMQAAPINYAKEAYGLQTGAISYAKKFRGIQFSLINICGEDSEGLQVGLINYRKGAPWYARFIPFFAFRTKKKST